MRHRLAAGHLTQPRHQPSAVPLRRHRHNAILRERLVRGNSTFASPSLEAIPSQGHHDHTGLRNGKIDSATQIQHRLQLNQVAASVAIS